MRELMQPLNRLPTRADWEQALIRARWPDGAPYEYRKGAQAYADQYAELLAVAAQGGAYPTLPAPIQGGTGSGFRWACVHCRSNGPADSADHAVALTGTHWSWACSATATVYDDQPPAFIDKMGRLHFSSGGGDGYVQRVSRHRVMHRLYPDLVPEWTGSFRGAGPITD